MLYTFISPLMFWLRDAIRARMAARTACRQTGRDWTEDDATELIYLHTTFKGICLR